jgi:hypothetical protein
MRIWQEKCMSTLHRAFLPTAYVIWNWDKNEHSQRKGRAKKAAQRTKGGGGEASCIMKSKCPVLDNNLQEEVQKISLGRRLFKRYEGSRKLIKVPFNSMKNAWNISPPPEYLPRRNFENWRMPLAARMSLGSSTLVPSAHWSRKYLQTDVTVIASALNPAADSQIILGFSQITGK